MGFIDREKELRILEEEYKKGVARLIIIYGRRRIGKTRLIEEFLSNKKDYVYYLAADEEDNLQIKELKLMLGKTFNDDFLISHEFKEWKELFSYLEKTWPKDKNLLIIIDEVTFIIKNNPSFPSYLQQFWDRFLSKTQTKVILSGSLVGLMLKSLLSGESPLYGRRTAEIFLEEFKITDVRKFLDMSEIQRISEHAQKPSVFDKSFEDTIGFFSILGGIPKYLEIVDTDFKGFLDKLFDKKGFFYREGIYLMTEEFKDISTYSNILKSISEGNSKLNEISNYSGIESKKISAYLDILENIGFIEGIAPVTKIKEKFRGRIYIIKDSFLDFWFRFINKNRSLIELDKKEELIKGIYKEVNSFIGRKFEKVCLQFLILSNIFSFTKIGKQWGKIPNASKDKNQYEIDIVALNEKTKEILFAECKWQDKIDAENIIRELKEKAKYVEWNNGNRKESYAIFAKSFSKKINKFEGKEAYCFDLRDIEKLLKK